MRRGIKVLSLLAVVAVVGAACSKKSTTTSGANLPGTGKLICEVSDSGGFDDKSFNQTAHKGVTDAKSQLGVSSVFLESHTDQVYVPNVTACVGKKPALTVTVGFFLAPATAAAAKANPNLDFAIVDDCFDPNNPFCEKEGPFDNVQGLTFKTDQAAFLAGYLAAGMTKTGTVGTFGGANIPTVTIFMNGFAAGILKFNQDNGGHVKLLGWNPATQDGTFTGNFTNKDQGRTIAQQFINSGADIILPVAGPVGLGAAQAAKQAGNVMMIGVDTDQFVSAPEFGSLWLTSVAKHIDVAVLASIKDVVNGTFKGSSYIGTLANDGVGIAPFHDFDSKVPASLKSKLDDIKKGIIDGSISVDPKTYLSA